MHWGALLEEEGQDLSAVIQMKVDDDVLVERNHRPLHLRQLRRGLQRHQQSRFRPMAGAPPAVAPSFKRRPDDNEESLRTRLMAYYKQTSPLIGYYHAKGLLRNVDGLGEIEDVAAEIAAVLD